MPAEEKVQIETKESAPDLLGDLKKVQEIAHDTAPAIITDHKFSPRGDWYTLCKICRLAESAHAETENVRPHIGYYADDD